MSLHSKRSRAWNEFPRNRSLPARLCPVCEQRQTVEGLLPRLQGHAEASLHFANDSTACDSGAKSFSLLHTFLAIPPGLFSWRNVEGNSAQPSENSNEGNNRSSDECRS